MTGFPSASPVAESEPVRLYLETTNRCNLFRTTCPRTFEALEPPADMSWLLFTSMVDQFPKIARVVLHGVGEPMMVRELPRMFRYLKERGTYERRMKPRSEHRSHEPGPRNGRHRVSVATRLDDGDLLALAAGESCDRRLPYSTVAGQRSVEHVATWIFHFLIGLMCGSRRFGNSHPIIRITRSNRRRPASTTG
jgi:hypothetical protein